MKVRFSKGYDHRWPSRAITHYPAGWEGTVKREAGEAAVSKGYATEVRGRGKNRADAETSDMAATDQLAGCDGHADSGDGIPVHGDETSGQ